MSFGEWRYEPSGDSDGETVGTDHFVIERTGQGENDWREIACPPTKGHAALIAAAPDLLAALETLENATRGVEDLKGCCEITVAREAIKKATGAYPG